MLHAKALAIATAYGIYVECIEGHVSKKWRIPEDFGALSFYCFRERLSEQMLEYY